MMVPGILLPLLSHVNCRSLKLSPIEMVFIDSAVDPHELILFMTLEEDTMEVLQSYAGHDYFVV